MNAPKVSPAVELHNESTLLYIAQEKHERSIRKALVKMPTVAFYQDRFASVPCLLPLMLLGVGPWWLV